MEEQRGNQQGEWTVEIRSVPLPISLITLSWPNIPLSGSHTTLWVPLGGQYRTVFDAEGHLSLALYALELITFEILAAERLRLMGFDNRLIIECFANDVNILIWQFSLSLRQRRCRP